MSDDDNKDAKATSANLSAKKKVFLNSIVYSRSYTIAWRQQDERNGSLDCGFPIATGDGLADATWLDFRSMKVHQPSFCRRYDDESDFRMIWVRVDLIAKARPARTPLSPADLHDRRSSDRHGSRRSGLKRNGKWSWQTPPVDGPTEVCFQSCPRCSMATADSISMARNAPSTA
jgi:hypothetical protein